MYRQQQMYLHIYEPRWRFRREGIDESDVNVTTGGGKWTAEGSKRFVFLFFLSRYLCIILYYIVSRGAFCFVRVLQVTMLGEYLRCVTIISSSSYYIIITIWCVCVCVCLAISISYYNNMSCFVYDPLQTVLGVVNGNAGFYSTPPPSPSTVTILHSLTT